jgi:hypothetical protein
MFMIVFGAPSPNVNHCQQQFPSSLPGSAHDDMRYYFMQ